jgi:hypothetical protein
VKSLCFSFKVIKLNTQIKKWQVNPSANIDLPGFRFILSRALYLISRKLKAKGEMGDGAEGRKISFFK